VRVVSPGAGRDPDALRPDQDVTDPDVTDPDLTDPDVTDWHVTGARLDKRCATEALSTRVR
jgi:hypothetical protein